MVWNLSLSASHWMFVRTSSLDRLQFASFPTGSRKRLTRCRAITYLLPYLFKRPIRARNPFEWLSACSHLKHIVDAYHWLNYSEAFPKGVQSKPRAYRMSGHPGKLKSAGTYLHKVPMIPFAKPNISLMAAARHEISGLISGTC
jgi:hypothetical protein